MARERAFYGLDTNDRLLCISGVPLSHLKKSIDPSKFLFYHTSYQNQNNPQSTILIQPDTQQQFFHHVLHKIEAFGNSGLYAIGSFPTKQAGEQLGTLITKRFNDHAMAQAQYPRIRWIDVGRPNFDFLKSSEECDLVAVFGLTDQSDNRKMELARDFIRRSEGSAVLLIATTPNILTFAIEKIKEQPKIVWQLGNIVNRTVM